TSPELPKLVEKAQRTHSWLKPKLLLADRGYDSVANHTALVKRGIIPIIHIRRMRGLSGGVYHQSGVPVCGDGKTKMEYLGTHPKTGQHAYRCPPAGCQLKSRSSGAMIYCAPTLHWEDPMNNLRVLGIVARASPEWRALYKRRPIIERLFGSMKRTRLLDKHQYRGQRKVEAHITLSVLTYLATMLVRARAGDMKRLRHMRIR
ncbi:MAG: transposase, partial [Dehalococcoidia bacterium]|nr:transposase [Dehalococcoidia bacterium]